MSEPAHRLLDDLDVRSQYVEPRPPVFFNSISGPLLDNLIWTNITRRGLWLWTLYHCNLCNLNVALNKMMMIMMIIMMMMMMITWIHYVSKKYRRQADRKVILLIGASQLPQVCGYSISEELSESVFDLHEVHGLFLERCIDIEPKPKFDDSVSDLQTKLGKKWKNVLKSISPWATRIACQGCMTSYTMRTLNLWKFLAQYMMIKLWIILLQMSQLLQN